VTKSSSDSAVTDQHVLSRGALLDRFEAFFHIDPPKRLSRELAQQNIHWAEQATSEGGDHRALRRRLLNGLEKALSLSAKPRSIATEPGTRLIREWRGCTYEVHVSTDGYLYDGKV